jgi:hypothetical protein
MNRGYANYPIVTQAQFERAMQEFDYCREGWSDCIVYFDRTNQRKGDLGYEVDGKFNTDAPPSGSWRSRRELPTFRLHPDLAREVVAW